MISLVVIVLAFVLTGLTVVALAMRSGRKSTSRATKKGQRLTLIGAIAVTLAFGIGLPAIVLAYNGGDQSKAAPGGLKLTAAQEHGRQLFTKNCANCHVLAAANAVGRVGPVLDDIIPAIASEKDRIAFLKDAIRNGRARGNGQMPKGVVDGTDEDEVASFVATSAGR